ncbi:transcriptional regulator [Ensifer adhaerens]|nr:transcriptional regulator [Ensifer adhaerens]
MISSEQIRAARALIRWDQAELAKHANVSVETIKRLEKINGPLLTATGKTLQAIQSTLEHAGIIFIAQNGNGPGVRLRDRQS